VIGLFDRKLTLSITDAFGHITEITQDDARMAFAFQRAISYSPGAISIDLFQLPGEIEGAVRSAQSLNLIAQDTKRVNLFSGDGVLVETRYQDGKKITSIMAIDGDTFITSFASFTLAAGNTLHQLLEACAARGSVSISIGSYPPVMDAIRLPRAVSVHGNAMARIRQLAASVDAACFVQNGSLHIVSADIPQAAPMLLNVETGLIGEPKKTETGAAFQTRVLPLLLNDMVQIESETINGIFRIVAASGRGDTKSGEWQCTYTAIDNTVMAAKNSGIWR
jgi:hypothetical protein